MIWKKNRSKREHPARRLAALALTGALLLGMAPVYTLPARADELSGAAEEAGASNSWVQERLNKLVDWGIMRGDQEGNLDPDREITRAEYVSMINRAYGYSELGSTPFTDVDGTEWYADDIAIAYQAGYFQGTSETTASPTMTLTREEAAVILGRNLMLRTSTGEALQFSDSRLLSDWSRGLVEAAAGEGVVLGYPDNTFRPQNNITRGEVASLLVNAIGTPVNTPGEHTLGSVYGNVTISASGVTLKDTVIAGDLYITGGVGLGNVTLENVTVLGKIVASGAGEANKGDSSIILRNVTAGKMVVDSPANQYVTIRAEGDTQVDATSVRTPTYLEDATPSGLGLLYIELDGEDGTSLELAGNIEEVVNLTPDSRLVLAQGTAEKVTIDEAATGSDLVIENGASAKEVNLDVATDVTGTGDIGKLNVNAAGSSVSMLPDSITIRPGLSADIAGETMDTVTAAESSEDPRLLSGYPAARNVAPTSCEAVFSTNKKGTVYWAVSALADGSVGEEDLISPPAYTGKILKSGSVVVDASKTEEMVKITGLTSDGSYYLSAVMVDSRGQRSPVKVTAFTTPDDTVPKFATGYPYMSKITNTSAQVAVMPSKSCELYYALLPKGSTAPTAADFKAGAITGNLGYGSMDVKKNIASFFTVNGQTLKELETYDLYLWLTDFDGVKSSSVTKLTFTTVDKTPPVFLTEPTVNSIKETSVGLISALNENGTIYWVVVKQGEEYPKPMAGQTAKPSLSSEAAKLQVANGMNALKSGKVNATANKDVTINVSGLEGQTAYDLYYLAQDKAGNYSDTVKMITIHTLDTVPPEISQEFTKTADEEGEDPLPDTDIKIIFSEGIQDVGGDILLELYQDSKDTSKPQSDRDAAAAKLLSLLRKDIQLWDASSYPYELVPEKSDDIVSGNWIDYHDVQITMEDGKTVVIFKHGTNLNLSSGGTYYFQIADIADTSNNKNLIKPNPQKLPEFTTVFAQINLTSEGISGVPKDSTGGDVDVDMSFQMHPMSTGSVDDSIYYDVFLWSDSIVKFKLYARVTDQSGKTVTKEDPMFAESGGSVDENGWVYLGEETLTPDTAKGESVGKSVHRLINRTSSFPRLNTLKEDWVYEYAVSLTQVGNLPDRETWSTRVTMGVTIPAGPEGNVSNLATLINEDTWKSYLANGIAKGGVRSIGNPEDFEVFKQFTDTQVPKFTTVYPTFDPGDSFVTMHLQLDRPGTVYYAIAPIQKTEKGSPYLPALETRDQNGEVKPDLTPGEEYPPTSGGEENISRCPVLVTPVELDIYQPNFTSTRIKSGSESLRTGIADVRVEDLEPETIYYAYFVLKGESQNLSQVYCFQFSTVKVETPAVILDENSPSVNVKTTTPSQMNWILYANDSLFPMLGESFLGYVLSEKKADYESNWETYFPSIVAEKDSTASTPTVLDALLTTMNDGSYKSVFDEYANEIAYDEVLGRITGQVTGDVEYAGRGGPEALKENTPFPVDCTDIMTPETQYYFLAAARNENGTAYGFKAVGNVHLPDKTPPEFKSVTTTRGAMAAFPTQNDPVYNVPQSQWQKDPSQYIYKGQVTIEFTEKVYQLLVDQSGKKTLIELTKENLGEKLGLTGDGFKIEVLRVGSTITLSYEGAMNGYSIFLFEEGAISDANSNSHDQGQRLKLTFDTTMTTKDIDPDAKLELPSPGFRATWETE